MGRIIEVSICTCLNLVTGSEGLARNELPISDNQVSFCEVFPLPFVFPPVVQPFRHSMKKSSSAEVLKRRGECRCLVRPLFGDIEGGDPVGFGERGKVKDVFDELIDGYVVE